MVKQVGPELLTKYAIYLAKNYKSFWIMYM